MKERNPTWSLPGAVYRIIEIDNELTLGDRLLMNKEIVKFLDEHVMEPFDKRPGPDFWEAGIVLARLKKYGFVTKDFDDNRREMVFNYSYYEDQIGNPKAGNKIRSALLNNGRDIEGD